MSMKNSSDTIGNRTRDLPTCSAVPQPTAPPRAPNTVHSVGHNPVLVIFSKSTITTRMKRITGTNGPSYHIVIVINFQWKNYSKDWFAVASWCLDIGVMWRTYGNGMRQCTASASLLMHVASSLLNELRPRQLLQKRNVVDIFCSMSLIFGTSVQGWVDVKYALNIAPYSYSPM